MGGRIRLNALVAHPDGTKFCAKRAMATIPCAWAKKSAKPFSAEAAMLFSKRSTAKVSRCRNNREQVSGVRSQSQERETAVREPYHEATETEAAG